MSADVQHLETVRMLLTDIELELLSPKYVNRTHGIPATAKYGCTGPLCRWAARNRERERYRKRAAESGKPITRTRHHERTRFDHLIEKIAEAHWSDREAIVHPEPDTVAL